MPLAPSSSSVSSPPPPSPSQSACLVYLCEYFAALFDFRAFLPKGYARFWLFAFCSASTRLFSPPDSRLFLIDAAYPTFCE
eukprot:3795291-Pleurochrysis_carterae.AAC.1